jgi:hypothetical protein
VRLVGDDHESSVRQEIGRAPTPSSVDEGVPLSDDDNSGLTNRGQAFLDAVGEDHPRGRRQTERIVSGRSSNTLEDDRFRLACQSTKGTEELTPP